MTYQRCDRCGVMTPDRNRIEVHDDVMRSDVFILCVSCRKVVERAVRETIGLHVGIRECPEVEEQGHTG